MSTELLEPDTETPNLELMPRADAVAILDSYRTKAEALRHTAETLVITDPEDTKGMSLARATRLSLRTIRTEMEKKRVAMVEDMTKETRRINSTAKAVKDFIEPLEARLMEMEQFAERERERLRNKLRQDRLDELAPYLTSAPSVDVGLMEPDSYATFLADQKDLHGLRMQREKAAEQARLAKEQAEAEERERMRLENERLKAEAEERERVAADERRKAEEERKAVEEAARKEREAAAEALRIEREAREAEAKKEREAAAAKQREIEAAAAEERRKAEAALRQEREAREAAERRQREAEAAEKARKAAEEEASRKAAAAPDKEKLLAFAETVKALAVPSASSPAGQAVAAEVAAKVAGFARWIATQANTL